LFVGQAMFAHHQLLQRNFTRFSSSSITQLQFSQPINQSIKSHTREESSRHTRHWSTLLSTQRQNRHDRVLRQLESHSKECVESLDRFLIGPNHHHHQFKPLSSTLLCQNPSSIKFFKRSIDSRSVKRTRLLLNPISNHQSNRVSCNDPPSMRASEQASARANLEEKSRLVPSLESRSSPSSTFFDDDTHSIRPFQQSIQATVPATAQLPATTARSTAIEDLGSSHRACSTRSRSIGWSVSARAPSRRQTPSHSISLDILESILRV